MATNIFHMMATVGMEKVTMTWGAMSGTWKTDLKVCYVWWLLKGGGNFLKMEEECSGGALRMLFPHPGLPPPGHLYKCISLSCVSTSAEL